MDEQNQPPKAQLPETVQAVKSLERKRLESALGNSTTAPVLSSGGQQNLWVRMRAQVSALLPNSPRLRLLVKLTIGAATIVAALLVLYFVLQLTAIDTMLFKLSLSGRVLDQDGQPVANAAIALDDQTSARTGEDGSYSFSGLELKRYTVNITANGYEDFEQEIALSRGFFNYSDKRDFTIQSSALGTVIGKLDAKDASYKFLDNRLIVDEQEFIIKADGTFELPNLKVGNRELKFVSANFLDFSRQVKVGPGNNELEPIELEAAGDVIGSTKSWLREDIVTNLTIEVENVPTAQVTVTEGGQLTVADLEVGREYKLRVSAGGYHTRDYKITIKQGLNDLFGFKLVELGLVPFIFEVDNKQQLFVAELDGANRKQITSGTTEPYAEQIIGSQVYFLSTRDNLSGGGGIGGETFLAYATSAAGGNQQRLTTNTQNIGRVIPNFMAAKLANVREGDADDHRVLELMDLAGSNRQEVKYIEDGVFDDVVISDNAKFVYYYAQNDSEQLNGLYRFDVNAGTETKLFNKRNIQIYAVSPSGNRVLYTATNDQTGLTDLFLYTQSSGQNTTLKQAYTGSQYQFVRDSENRVLFFDQQSGASNVFMLNVDTQDQQKLTSFGGVEGVEAVYQQADFVVYQTNKGLYALDVDKPVSGKLITNQIERYTGYDF